MENKIFIDSCVYLRMILGENGADVCENYLDELSKRNVKIFISVGVIYEVIKRIEKEINKPEENYKFKERRIDRKREELTNHIILFEKKLKDLKIQVLTNTNKEDSCLSECFKSIRNGGEMGDWDSVHLSYAIDNFCTEFVTTDSAIYNEKETIIKISNKEMEDGSNYKINIRHLETR